MQLTAFQTHKRASMREGLVSTIIPVYNRQHMLADAVESVLRQTYRPIEIIIVDDGSTDDTARIANAFEEEHTFIKVIRIENSGVGIAREIGRQQAEGEFIQYLDSDDLLKKNKFTLQVEMLSKSQQAGTCYGKTDLFISSNSSTIKNLKRTGEKIDSLLPSMLEGRWWSTSSALYRRRICDLAGPWQNLINEEDWEYDCRIALSNNNLCYVDETVSIIRSHDAPRLSHHGSSDVKKLSSRAQAHQLIVSHAIAFGLDSTTAEFEHLLVACFLLSRQCAVMGLINESKQLLLIARKHLKTNRNQRLKLVIYHWCCRLVGWQTMGKVSQLIDAARP